LEFRTVILLHPSNYAAGFQIGSTQNCSENGHFRESDDALIDRITACIVKPHRSFLDTGKPFLFYQFRPIAWPLGVLLMVESQEGLFSD
jgi:hypothetical protein